MKGGGCTLRFKDRIEAGLIREDPLGHSHQPLQRPLLVDLIGAVRHVGLKVGLGVFGDDVADVVNDNVLLVSFFQLLEEPESRGKEVLALGQEVTLELGVAVEGLKTRG